MKCDNVKYLIWQKEAIAHIQIKIISQPNCGL